jgi:hypothetical protein
MSLQEGVILGIVGSVAGVLVLAWVVRTVRRAAQWVSDLFTPAGVTFGIAEVPLSVHEWQRFAGLALARNISQKALLAEAVKFFIAYETEYRTRR